jgi:hypothetical protein
VQHDEPRLFTCCDLIVNNPGASADFDVLEYQEPLNRNFLFGDPADKSVRAGERSDSKSKQLFGPVPNTGFRFRQTGQCANVTSEGNMGISTQIRKSIGLCGAVALFVAADIAVSQSVDPLFQTSDRKLRLAQASQQKVDAIVKDTRKLSDQYRTVLKEIDGLEVYNTLLERQVSDQEAEMTELAASIDKVTDIERLIMPTMIKMIDALGEFIEMDLPFLIDERRKRVNGLRSLMERSDVSVAEKFRRVMESYQIEMNDYGRTMETYKAMLPIDGAEREVEILKIGRVALLYQSTDQAFSGVWNQQSREWEPLPAAYKSQLRQGLRIAQKQVAPELMMVPVAAPEAGQ